LNCYIIVVELMRFDFNLSIAFHKSVPSPANDFAAPKSPNPPFAGQIQSLQSDFASVGAVSNCLG